MKEQKATPDLNAQIAELTNDLQRTRADFENFRKQTDAQREQAKTLAANATVIKLLPLLDDLALAIAAHPELKPLEKTFKKTLSELNLEQINSAPGTDFNPDLHEAVTMEDGEGEREVIIETLRPGYLYQGQVLRATMVKVGHEK
ncbi:nucleotide exchange factor GrpE [Candidatus Saccharibacteria bacterium]|nr:nucleotide exchange factor GrpE [Candidatus Saccharibacteria bacterium]